MTKQNKLKVMSKKGFRKFASKLKKFGQTKVGKILKVAAVGGGALLAGNVLTGGRAVKGIASGAKRLLAKSQSGEKKGGFLRGLFSRKNKGNRGLGAALSPDEKQNFVSTGLGSLDRKLKRFKKSGVKLDAQKEELTNVLQNVQSELGQNPDFVNYASNGNFDPNLALNAVNDYQPEFARQVSDVSTGEINPVVKGAAVAGGVALGAWGLGKIFGVIK